MRYLLILLIPLFVFGVKLDYKYINSNYKALSIQQKANIRQAFSIGETLIIDGESYGFTIATFDFIESSSGRILSGDNDSSFGRTHIQIPRAREILEASIYFQGLNSLSDTKLAYTLRTNDHLNLLLCGINFKLNLAKWGSYSAAIRAHNGYNPPRFYNRHYYARFINAMQIVKKVIHESTPTKLKD